MKPFDNATAGAAIVTEWEDNVVFDADDPDFSTGTATAASVLMRSASGTQQQQQQMAKLASNLTRSVTTYYGLNSASVVSNFNHLMKGEFISYDKGIG
ncbi:hypothetical protein ZHAS_00017669 [Anopheles sinensis]|uniref:Uncharacterized protein n=1 Tax=Anopheles sinensis TaxID=74873 RepID=A0A084WHF4_ANOSI|nr:hypothetical protein ZHAS_00017669 [Anopheles sinensis]